MLRISIQEGADIITMKLEGKISGPWTAEFSKAWQVVASSLGSRRLNVDLCGLTYIDAYGAQLLREIHEKSHAEFIADSPLTKYFAEQAKRKISGNGTKGRKGA